MKYSDEILAKSQRRGLTMSERVELREAYNYEQAQQRNSINQLKKSVKEFKDTKQPARELTNCPNFIECPLDLKCRNYNPAYVACLNCVLHETDDICMKPRLHTDKAFNMMISRERIELDGKENA